MNPALFHHSLASLRVSDARLFAWLVSVLAWLLWGLVPPAGAQDSLPAERLTIVAVIHGVDELRLSRQNAQWIHKTGPPPTEVEINGRKWNPQQRPILTPSPLEGLDRKDADLSGVVLHTIRGRGSVQLGRDCESLVIRFEDHPAGADTYEVTLDFAGMLARNKTPAASRDDLELRLKARIDGMDEVWLSRNEARWIHKERSPPAEVTANGRPWDTAKSPVLALQPALMPEAMDLQRATLSKTAGRGIVSLDYRPERLCIDFEDLASGADEYEVLLKVPRFGDRHLVRVHADVGGALTGAALRIYRFPAESEARDLLAGQRVFDARGQCLVALESGQYQFEVLHQAGARTLVALKTDILNIKAPMTVDLKARQAEPRLIGPGNRLMVLDDLAVRSVRRQGAVSWTAAPNSKAASPVLILSEGQSYMIHVFGHAGSDYAALWKSVTLREIPAITLDPGQWLACSFRWQEGTPHSIRNGVVLQFPDGHLDISQPEASRFFTNRRFFNLAYWLAFSGKRKAVFQPRGYLLPPAAGREFVLGGPLHPLASAALMQDEHLGRGSRRIWWEITLGDPQNHLLDKASSKLEWTPTLSMQDGTSLPSLPFTPEDVRRLGNMKDTLMARVTYRMETKCSVSAPPEPFVVSRFPHCSTKAPSYRDWNTRTYLNKVERELEAIASARQIPLSPKHRVEIKWWLNTGAVGSVGQGSVTMPFSTYLHCQDWFHHAWGIAHEMLHNFRYGHTHEIVRLDRDVQERMEQFRWSAVDHPEFVPEGWAEMPAQPSR
ncbi:MAG: hypothetical protein HZA88_10985 [Verrucomicrobia bacterium]|nr:hypothetical protein [Verrucomicrobiota bacterium]